MDKDEFLQALRADAVFADLDHWHIEAVGGGLVSPNVYRLRRGERDLFAKEAQDHERDVLRRIMPLGLRHVLRVLCPELLDRNILVAQFIGGGHLRSARLEPGLIRDFATVQNRLHERPPNDGGRQFFREGVLRAWRDGSQKLRGLRAEQGWPAADHLRPGPFVRRRAVLLRPRAVLPAAPPEPGGLRRALGDLPARVRSAGPALAPPRRRRTVLGLPALLR